MFEDFLARGVALDGVQGFQLRGARHGGKADRSGSEQRAGQETLREIVEQNGNPRIRISASLFTQL